MRSIIITRIDSVDKLKKLKWQWAGYVDIRMDEISTGTVSKECKMVKEEEIRQMCRMR